MWLIIRDADHTVIGTNYTQEPSVPAGHAVKEWYGPEPEIGAVDPTLADTGYTDFLQRRIDFADLEDQAISEIDWLNTNIPLVAGADLATLRAYLERAMRENRQMIKAWRYVFSKFSS